MFLSFTEFICIQNRQAQRAYYPWRDRVEETEAMLRHGLGLKDLTTHL